MHSQDFESIANVPVKKRLKLPPSVAYQTRKILRQNLDRLKSAIAPGAGIPADPLSNLDQILSRLYIDEDDLNDAIQQLEKLTLSHKVLSGQNSRYQLQVKTIEAKIFELLGYTLQTNQTNQGTILIVDDTPENLRLLFGTLSDQGYEVCSALSGHFALEIVQETDPDLILLDVRMPGIDGFEVCKQLKAATLTQDIPIVFISAVDTVEDKVRGFEVGGADYIVKPFELQEVLARVGHQMNLRMLQKRLGNQNVRLQQEMRERQQVEDCYRGIFENSSDGLFQSTEEGRFLRANPALAAMYGYDSPEHLMETMTNIGQQLYVDPDRRRALNALIHQHGSVSKFESEVHHRQGHTFWISESVRMVTDKFGKPVFYEGTVRDITTRKQAEDQIQQAQTYLMQREHLLALGKLSIGLAQEMHRPTNAIHRALGAIQHLLDVISQRYPQLIEESLAELHTMPGADLHRDVPKLLGSIRANANRIRKLAMALRNGAHADATEKQDIDLEQSLEDTLLLLKFRLRAQPQRPAIALHKTFASLPPLPAHAGPLSQVWMSLLANALDALDVYWQQCIQAMEQDPSLPSPPPPSLHITTQRIGTTHIGVTIADRGTGIPPEIQTRIFEPCFTTKSGTGMGLAIVHQIITDLHQGAITCHSVVGQGTTFEILLPLAPAAGDRRAE